MIGAGGASLFNFVFLSISRRRRVSKACPVVLSGPRRGARRWIVAGAAPMRPEGRKEPLHACRRAPQGSA